MLNVLVEKFLSEFNTKLLSDGIEFLKVLLVLFFVLDLNLKTLKQSNSSGIVVYTSAGLESLLEHRGSRDKIVGEDVVKKTLDFKKIVGFFKLLFESVG